jgi:hypothetical protein
MGALHALEHCIEANARVDELAHACQEALRHSYNHSLRVLEFTDSCHRTITETVTQLERGSAKRGRNSIAEGL